MLVAAIKAEYHQLSPGMGMRDSYTLTGLFYQLRLKLGMPAAREPAKAAGVEGEAGPNGKKPGPAPTKPEPKK